MLRGGCEDRNTLVHQQRSSDMRTENTIDSVQLVHPGTRKQSTTLHSEAQALLYIEDEPPRKYSPSVISANVTSTRTELTLR